MQTGISHPGSHLLPLEAIIKKVDASKSCHIILVLLERDCLTQNSLRENGRFKSCLGSRKILEGIC